MSRDDVLRQDLPLPSGDYLVETVEERMIIHADKFLTKTTPPMLLTADV